METWGEDPFLTGKLGVAFRELLPAIEQGLITEADIDLNLAYLLKTRFKLGLFDPPGRNPWELIPVSVINCDKHKEIAREAAVKSIVLLKNNGVLSLKKDLHRYIITGPLAADVTVLLGNYNGVPAGYRSSFRNQWISSHPLMIIRWLDVPIST